MIGHKVSAALVCAVMAAGVLGGAWAVGQAQRTAPSTRPAGGAGGGGGGGQAMMQQMGTAMVREIRGVEGCLGAEAGQFSGGRFVIMAWFKDKAAAKRWYYHPMHQRMRAAAGMPGEPEGTAKEEPMSEIPDNTPILAIATMTFGGTPIEGSQIPFSGISIELYGGMHEALNIGKGFAPAGFFAKEEATTQPAK